MDDDGLIVRVVAGDDTALRELFSRHAPWLAARLRVVLPAADVEDVLQQTFLAVWKGAGATGQGARSVAGCGVGHCLEQGIPIGQAVSTGQPM
jgi:DNA-directed RNA polymerase specialized sigma24 family protein